MPQHLATQASEISTLKKELRRAFRDRRQALSSAERQRQEDATLAHLLHFGPLISADNVALYAPVRSELNTSRLARELETRGKTTLYPRCVDGPQLEFAAASLDSDPDWTAGPFGVREPTRPSFPIEDIDLVILPLLAIDEHGNRLGYGAGYYDRWLSRHPTLQANTVGIAYREQITPQPIPVEDNDIPLTWLATADGVRKLPSRKPLLR